MRHLALSLTLVSILLVPGLAKADSFKVAINSAPLGVSTVGTLTGTNNNDGSFTITSITGTGITGLIASSDPFFGNDNLLLPTQSRLFDVNGLAFTGIFSGLSLSLDLYSTVSGYEVLAVDSLGNISNPAATASIVTVTAATPEPSSLVFSFTGVLAAAFFCLGKRKYGSAI